MKDDEAVLNEVATPEPDNPKGGSSEPPNPVVIVVYRDSLEDLVLEEEVEVDEEHESKQIGLRQLTWWLVDATAGALIAWLVFQWLG